MSLKHAWLGRQVIPNSRIPQDRMASVDAPIHGSVTGVPSPWFARVAADLLDSGNIKEALRICVEGTRVSEIHDGPIDARKML